MSARLVSVDEPHAPPEQRGLFAVIDDEGGTLAVGHLEPVDDAIGLAPGSTVGLRFRIVGGIRA